MNARDKNKTPGDATENEDIVVDGDEAGAETFADDTTCVQGEENVSDAEVFSVEEMVDKARMLEERLRRTEEALKRERADVVNYRRRVEQRAEEMRRAIRAEMISDLFPVFDTFFHTAQGLEQHKHFEGLREAFDVLAGEMREVFRAWGVCRAGEPGETFDPERHEAVFSRAVEGVETPEVDEVIKPGYVQEGRVLRPAQVVVKQPPPQEARDAACEEETGEGETGADV